MLTASQLDLCRQISPDQHKNKCECLHGGDEGLNHSALLGFWHAVDVTPYGRYCTRHCRQPHRQSLRRPVNALRPHSSASIEKAPAR